MSLAGLQENVAQDMHVVCNGGATFYGHFFACDKHHGMVDINNAIPWSCDTFYYTLANRLGIDTIAKYATEVGISQKTGIDLPDEVAGTMPSTAWKLKTQHEKWYAGETISVGIGQGAITATPLQLARALSGIASGGVLRRPHVVFPDEVPPEQLQAIHENLPRLRRQDHPPHARKLGDHHRRHGQRHQSPIGTAAAVHLEGIDFAGKTGTAQVVSHERLRDQLGNGHKTAPTPGSSAWRRAATPTSSSPSCGSTATGATTPPSSPRRSSTPSSPSSASAPTT